jgi:hypothetical protein
MSTRHWAGSIEDFLRCPMAARAIAVLKLSNKVKTLITFAQSVTTAMTSNATFPTPNPTLATFQADIEALNTAETAVVARTKGAADTRNAKLAVVKADLESLKNYVQNVVDASNPANAESIIGSAGMAIRKVTLHDKAALAVKQGTVSGTVTLSAKAAATKAAYNWQYSTDQKTWTSLPQTLKAKTGVSGLTSATTYYFRSQALTPKGGESDWGQTISLLVK